MAENFCSNCGNPLLQDDKFCFACGKSTVRTETSALTPHG
ncbi:MAG: zinc-ribbon domain-containing protein [Halobacteriota archaeon]